MDSFCLFVFLSLLRVSLCISLSVSFYFCFFLSLCISDFVCFITFILSVSLFDFVSPSVFNFLCLFLTLSFSLSISQSSCCHVLPFFQQTRLLLCGICKCLHFLCTSSHLHPCVDRPASAVALALKQQKMKLLCSFYAHSVHEMQLILVIGSLMFSVASVLNFLLPKTIFFWVSKSEI